MDKVKNLQFTRLFKTNGRLREFNFTKHHKADRSTFSVDVADDRGNRIIFQLHKNGEHWFIAEENVPAWIQRIETELTHTAEEASAPHDLATDAHSF
jgi:hypothetical protein